MPIDIAPAPKRIAWDDVETNRRMDQELERRMLDALTRARNFVEADLWEAGRDEQALDSADENLTAAVKQLKDRLEAPHRVERADLVSMCRLAVELQDLHREHQERRLGRRLRALNAMQEVLSRPQGDATLDKLLEHFTIQACRSCGFDRAMLFRVDGSTLRVQSTYFRDDAGWAAECHAVAKQNPAPLQTMLLETEMLRRRAACLMVDPMDDPRGFKPIVCKIETRGYAAVPIMLDGNVIATIHVDKHFTKRRVDTVDRDVVAAFAAGLGSMLERKLLVERLIGQSEHVRSMLHATEDFVRQFSSSEIRLDPPEPPVAGVVRAVEPRLAVASSSRTENLVSRREMEVLRLMAGGATNAMIAEQLVLSEGTVKSHVKRILRKLHAANRAEAVSRFLRLEGGVQAAEVAVEGILDLAPIQTG